MCKSGPGGRRGPRHAPAPSPPICPYIFASSWQEKNSLSRLSQGLHFRLCCIRTPVSICACAALVAAVASADGPASGLVPICCCFLIAPLRRGRFLGPRTLDAVFRFLLAAVAVSVGGGDDDVAKCYAVCGAIEAGFSFNIAAPFNIIISSVEFVCRLHPLVCGFKKRFSTPSENSLLRCSVCDATLAIVLKNNNSSRC